MGTKIKCTLCGIFLGISAFGQIADKEYAAAMQKMFAASGVDENCQVAINQMFNIFRSQYTGVSEAVWEELKNEFSQSAIDQLKERIIPVYAKHFTLKDVEEITRFYESPTGRKYAKKIPLITEESMQIGREWGEEIGRNFAKKMQEKNKKED